MYFHLLPGVPASFPMSSCPSGQGGGSQNLCGCQQSCWLHSCDHSPAFQIQDRILLSVLRCGENVSPVLTNEVFFEIFFFNVGHILKSY